MTRKNLQEKIKTQERISSIAKAFWFSFILITIIGIFNGAFTSTFSNQILPNTFFIAYILVGGLGSIASFWSYFMQVQLAQATDLALVEIEERLNTASETLKNTNEVVCELKSMIKEMSILKNKKTYFSSTKIAK